MDDDLKARLLKPRVPEGTVVLDGIGELRVRGLSRYEVAVIQAQNLPWPVLERKTVALGMVDPVMSEDDVKAWQEASPAGELEAVAEKINRLSGLTKGADKSGVSGVRDEPGPGVRALPGDQAFADGGPAAGADEQ